MKEFFGILFILSAFLIANSALAAEDNPNSEFKPWKFKISGEERARAEYKQNFDFNETSKDNGTQFYNRFRFGIGANLTDEASDPKLDIFVEGLDAQTGGYHIKPPLNQVDDLDLHQAYVVIHHFLAPDWDLKAGRQELKYGKARILDGPMWSNRVRSFDGGVLKYKKGGFYGDFLYGQDVKFDDGKFNRSRSEEFVSGFYGGYQKDKTSPLVELYFLSQVDIKGTNNIQRYTAGTHLQVNLKDGTVIDIEVPYQFGETGTTTAGTKDIKAYAYHVDASKNFDEITWKPKLYASYDEASGDQDPNDSKSNTFIATYQNTHGPYGLLDFFRWQNVRNPEAGFTLSPMGKLKIQPQMDWFWLQSKFDSWYNTSGSVVRSKTSGERGYFVGTEASIRAYYDFTKNLKLETGYAHFFPGGYVKDSGADDAVNWAYSSLTMKF